jgi:phosphonate transport system substrate-binding protein
METLPETNRECYIEISQGDGQGFKAIDHSFYEGVVAMRQRELEGSR